jgi:hypothetical protein
MRLRFAAVQLIGDFGTDHWYQVRRDAVWLA